MEKILNPFLLYNNSGGSLKLTRNNIATPQKSNGKQEVEQSIQKEKTVSKERTFTVHHNLITRETDDSYFVRIPNTMAKKYMYIPKKDTQWSANRENFSGNSIYERYLCDLSFGWATAGNMEL